MPIPVVKRKREYRDCELCGKRFVWRRSWARYCSTRCRLDASILRRSKVLAEHGVVAK